MVRTYCALGRCVKKGEDGIGEYEKAKIRVTSFMIDPYQTM